MFWGVFVNELIIKNWNLSLIKVFGAFAVAQQCDIRNLHENMAGWFVIFKEIQEKELWSYGCDGSVMSFSLLSVKLPVRISEPAERWFVFTGQPVMEIDQSVVTFHILIQCSFKIPAKIIHTNASSVKRVNVHLYRTLESIRFPSGRTSAACDGPAGAEGASCRSWTRSPSCQSCHLL